MLIKFEQNAIMLIFYFSIYIAVNFILWTFNKVANIQINQKKMEKLWNRKINIKWIMEVKEDMNELQIAIEDLKGKT